MKTLFSHRFRFQPWGIALAAVLVTGYFTFMVGAIYCQYLFQNNEEQHRTSSHPASHNKMHCLMANHGTMAATLSTESVGFNLLQFLTSVLSPGPVSTGSGDVIGNTARAPPPAVSTIV